MAEITKDSLWGGRLTLEQPRDGYRFNVDSVHLAELVGNERGVIVDLGAGVGAIGLGLCLLTRPRRVVLVEPDYDCAMLATRNAATNGFDQVEVLRASATEAAKTLRNQATLVVCNPPFFVPGTVRLPKRGKTARVGTLAPFVRAARAILTKKGRACFVYPAHDLEAMLGELSEAGLVAKRLRLVHPSVKKPARIALIEAKPAKPGGLIIEPPIYEHV